MGTACVKLQKRTTIRDTEFCAESVRTCFVSGTAALCLEGNGAPYAVYGRAGGAGSQTRGFFTRIAFDEIEI